jgi:hypothetical protein
LVSVILVCLTLLAILVGPAIIKMAKRMDELIRIGGEEDQPDPHPEKPLEPMLEDYLNRRPR